MNADLTKYSKEKLKELCTQFHFDTKGTKQVLIERLGTVQEQILTSPVVVDLQPPKENCIWIASFDIGKHNFAFCIEEMNVDRTKLCKIEKNKKNELESHVYPNGRILVLENVSISKGCTKNKFDPKLFVNMNQVLEQFQLYWKHCTHVIIEEQMSFGKNKTNGDASKLAQHCYSWFLIKFPEIKIQSFRAYHKTQVLCAPPKMTKPERKKWAVQEAKRILENRGDEVNLKKVNDCLKQDDLCDTCVQLQAFKALEFYH